VRLDKLTTQFQQALADAQSLALANEHQYIEPLHLLAAIIGEADGAGRALLDRAGVQTTQLKKSVDQAIARIPQVTGTGGEMQVGRDLAKVLNLAEQAALKRGDQYVATEMFLLALAMEEGRHAGEAGRLARDAGLRQSTLEQSIEAVRGGQPVESAEAEGQREALKKYTIDLTELAKQGKLEPVSGRDDEIRRTSQILQRRTKNNPLRLR